MGGGDEATEEGGGTCGVKNVHKETTEEGGTSKTMAGDNKSNASRMAHCAVQERTKEGGSRSVTVACGNRGYASTRTTGAINKDKIDNDYQLLGSNSDITSVSDFLKIFGSEDNNIPTGYSDENMRQVDFGPRDNNVPGGFGDMLDHGINNFVEGRINGVNLLANSATWAGEVENGREEHSGYVTEVTMNRIFDLKDKKIEALEEELRQFKEQVVAIYNHIRKGLPPLIGARVNVNSFVFGNSWHGGCMPGDGSEEQQATSEMENDNSG